MRCALALMTVLWGMAGASALHAQTAQAGATITAVSGISTLGVAVDRSGNLFVAGASSSITEVLAVNGVVSPSSARRSVGSGFNDPAGVVVDANGNVFVADQYNQATKEIVASGGVVSSTSTVTTIYNDPGFPVKVALDSMGDVFVADAGPYFGIREIVAANGAVSPTSTEMNVGGGFNNPYGVAVDGSGNVFVADTSNNAVKEILAVGGVVSSTSTVITVATGFDPSSVAVDGNGNVFATDYYNNEVKEIVAVNGVVSSSSTVVTLGTGFAYPFGVAVDVSGNVFVADLGNRAVKEIVAGAQQFPATAVGSPSAPLTTYFTFTTGGTLASTPFVVLTQGAQGKDFQASATQRTDACIPGYTYNAGDVCTVNVTFSPTRPFQRIGAVQLMGASGTPIATFNLRGTGNGPSVTFPSNSATISLGSGFSEPTGVAVDGSGDIFVTDAGTATVKEIVAGTGTVITVATNAGSPQQLAVDGSGNVFFADAANSAVREIVAVNGAVSAASPVNTVGSGFSQPHGVAVDGSGNVFVADYGNGNVKEIVAVNGVVSAGSVVNTIGTFLQPGGVAVDSSGDVFVDDIGLNRVFEMVAVNGVVSSRSQVVILYQGANPAALSVDGSGNVFFADASLNVIEELVAVNGVVPGSTTPITVAGGFSVPSGVAVDASGNLFVADYGNNAVKEIDRSDGPTLAFASTPVGTTSPDSPMSLLFANSGNQQLNAVPPGLSVGTNFSQVSGNGTVPDCTASFSLAPGQECNLSIDFTPQSVGQIQSAAVFFDNALNYYPFAVQPVTLTGTGSAIAPTIIFNVPNQTYGAAPFAVNATSNSNGAFTYSVVSGPATISGNIVTLTGAGQVTLQASQAASGIYTAGTQPAMFTVAQAAPTITFNVPNQTYGAAPFAVNATSNSSGAFTYSVVSGPATISGNIVTLTGAGQVVLQASQVASGNYAAGSQTAMFTVAQASPTITFNVPNQTYGAAPFAVNATSNSSGSFTYTVVKGPATISGNTVTLTGAGPVTLQASEAASTNYTAGSQTAMFTVAPAAPTITFNVPNQTYGAAPFAVNATSNSSGTFTYSVVNGPATISGNTVTLTGTGPVMLQASESAAGNYTAGVQTAQFMVAQAAPTITFNVPNQTYGAAPFQVTATSNSSGTFAYTVVRGPATISGNTVTLTGTGPVTLQASEAASGNYTAGTQTAQFTVAQAGSITSLAGSLNSTGGTAALTATVAPAAAGTYPAAQTGTVTFYDNGNAIGSPVTLSGGKASLTTPAYTGSQSFTAVYSGDSNYLASPASNTVVLSFTVNPTITFSTAATYTYGQSFQLSATSNSSGAFTYSLVSGPATVTGAGAVTITGEGLITVQANEAAANGYNAGSRQASFAAVKANGTTTLTATATKSGYGSAATLNATVAPQYSGVPTGSVTFYDGATLLATVALSGGKASYTTGQLVGAQHSYSATYTGDSNFNTSTSNTASLTIPVTAVNLQFVSTNLIYPLPPTYTVSVTPASGKPYPTGSVTIYDGAKAVASEPLYAITSGFQLGLVLPPLSVGQHTLTAVYSGDSNYAPGTSAPVVVTVTAGPVKLLLNCNSNSLKSGQTLTCLVNADEGVLPVTGTVTYTETGWGTGSVTLNKAGQATITYPTTSKGSFTLTASYVAQGNYQAAQPVTFNYTVN